LLPGTLRQQGRGGQREEEQVDCGLHTLPSVQQYNR